MTLCGLLPDTWLALTNRAFQAPAGGAHHWAQSSGVNGMQSSGLPKCPDPHHGPAPLAESLWAVPGLCRRLTGSLCVTGLLESSFIDSDSLWVDMVEVSGRCVHPTSLGEVTTPTKSLTLTAAAPPNKHVQCSPGGLVTCSHKRQRKNKSWHFQRIVHVVSPGPTLKLWTLVSLLHAPLCSLDMKCA